MQGRCGSRCARVEDRSEPDGLELDATSLRTFDKGFISFEDTGQLIVSPLADQTSLKRMGVELSGKKPLP
jgi:hypothetical protein